MSWVHFRKLKLSKKDSGQNECRTQISDISSQYGHVISLVVLQGRGQAMLQMDTPDAASNVIEYFNSLSEIERSCHLCKAVAEVGKGPRQDPSVSQSHTNIEQEVSRCINSMLKEVTCNYNKERHNERKNLGKRKVQEISSRDTGSSSSCDVKKSRQGKVCYEYVVNGGRCPRGDECRSDHVAFPIPELPAKYKIFIADNQFPVARELSPVKEQINSLLTSLSSSLSNKRCLVLDGRNSNTTQSLISCLVQKRTKEDVIIPNYCFETFEQIRGSGFGTAYYGSIRAYLDSLYFNAYNGAKGSSCQQGLDAAVLAKLTDESTRFGLVYLDYCCRLNAGFTSVEKSPQEDMHTLFRYGCMSRHRCGSILAVCFCREEDDVPGKEEEELVGIIATAASGSGYCATLLSQESKNYELMMLRVFHVVDAVGS